jgi:predicted choloylglycine hydrolase
MGYAQGEVAAGRIREARRTLRDLEAFRLQQPWWMPYAAFRRAAERRATAALGASLAEHDPAMLERLQGLAEGSRLRLETMCLFNALEALLSTVTQNTVTPGLCACSAVGVRGARSAGGEPVIARNFDYLQLVQPYYFLRESRPAGGYRALEFTTAPMAGTIDGINEHGLTITFNYAFVRDMPDCAVPISMAITDALATCRTVSEATDRIAKRPRWGAGILMLADAEGDLASLELSNTHSALRRPVSGEDYLFHTNHFQTPAMREVEVPPQAVFSNKAPAAIRGHRVLESAEHRSRRFEHLLAEHRPLSPDDLADLMGDHGEEESADHRTLCMHSEYWNTTACLQFFPRQRKMRVSYSSACDAQYTDFSL